MTTHWTRRGASRRTEPVGSYGELLDQPTRCARDDGSVLLHVGSITPTCSDCGRGQLLWAEAGYVAWHRICNVCGSHWDLHPLGMGIALVEVREEPTCGFPRSRRVCRHQHADRCAELAPGGLELLAAGARVHCACPCHVPPSQRRIVGVQPSVWCDGPGWVPIDPSWPIEVTVRELVFGARAPLASTRRPRRSGRTWGELVGLIQPEHVLAAEADRDRTLGVPCVPACWARRARFYRG